MAEVTSQKRVFRYRSGWLFAFLGYILVFSACWTFADSINHGEKRMPAEIVAIGPGLFLVALFFFIRFLFERIEIVGGTIKWFNWIGREKVRVSSSDIVRVEENTPGYGDFLPRYRRNSRPIDVITTTRHFRFWSGISGEDELVEYLRECVEKRIKLNL